MRRVHVAVVAASAVLTLGISMPSCPGQQAMQQQIDQVTAKQAEQQKQIQALDSHLRAMRDDVAAAKTLVAEVGNTVLAHKTALEQLDASVKDLATKAASPAKAAPKKRGR